MRKAMHSLISELCSAQALSLISEVRQSLDIFQGSNISTVGSRAFPAAASSIWNTLPENVVSASTLVI